MMKLYSPTIGIAIDLDDGGEFLAATNLVSNKDISPDFLKNAAAIVNDWEVLQEQKAHDTKVLARDYHLSRAIDYTIFLLQTGDYKSPDQDELQSLTKDILVEIDLILQEDVPATVYIDRLLQAPLRNPERMDCLRQESSALGLVAPLACFEEVLSYQELLRSFVDSWTDVVSDLVYSGENDSKGRCVWRLIVSTGMIRNLLHAGHRHDFLADWTSILTSIADLELRQYAARLGNGIASKRWQEPDRPKVGDLGGGDREILAERGNRKSKSVSPVSSHEAFENAMSQIEYIVDHVSKGKDQKARRVLNQLVNQQVRTDCGEEFAIRSLCNVAQQCADLYRLDFERECYDRVFQLGEGDIRAYVQFADHFKRKGDYEESFRVIHEAMRIWQDPILHTLKADVYAQRGELHQALAIYESVVEFSTCGWLDIAKADLLRKMGDLESAKCIYDRIISGRAIGNRLEFQDVLRARAGLAEIKKQQGDLEGSCTDYRYICSFALVDRKNARIYKMALCDILKRLEQYDEALQVVDDVVRSTPFFLQARYLRGALLGLRGQYLEGLNDFTSLPRSESFGSWLGHFFMGLLYLGLDRFDESRQKLLVDLQEALAAPEEHDIIRMSAVVYYLATENVVDAERYLPNEITSKNQLTRFLWITLKYHISARKPDGVEPIELETELLHAGPVDKGVLDVAEFIKKRDFRSAIAQEIQLLLRSA